MPSIKIFVFHPPPLPPASNVVFEVRALYDVGARNLTLCSTNHIKQHCLEGAGRAERGGLKLSGGFRKWLCDFYSKLWRCWLIISINSLDFVFQSSVSNTLGLLWSEKSKQSHNFRERLQVKLEMHQSEREAELATFGEGENQPATLGNNPPTSMILP